MKVNLTSGEVDLSLINDFRPIANINIPVQAQVGGSVEMPIYLGNDVLSATFDFPLGSVTFTADELHTFTLPFNPFAQDQVIDIYKDGEVYTTITQKGTGYA